MDNNKQYLSEEQYQKMAKRFKTIGLIMIIVGVITFLVCSVLLFGDLISFERRSIVGFLWVMGAACGGFGLVISFMGYGRELTAFQAQSTMPIVKEGAEKMAPTAGAVAKEIAKGVKEGINEADAAEEKEDE